MEREVLAPLLVGGRTHDPRGAVGQVVQEEGEGDLQVELDGVLVHHLHRLDDGVVEPGLQGLLRTDKAVEVVLHCLGVEGGAVVELHPLAEGERPAEAVLRLRPLGGQIGMQIHLGVEPDQVVVHHVADGLARVAVRVGRVQAVGIGPGSVHQRAAALGLCRPPGCRAHRDRQEHHPQKPSAASHRPALLS